MVGSVLRDALLVVGLLLVVVFVGAYLVFGFLHVLTRLVRWLLPHRRA